MINTRNLDTIFSPARVAVVGASDKPGKISGVIMDSLADAGFKGEVIPVNPNHDTVRGIACVPALSDVEGKVDLAVFAVPARLVPGLLAEATGIKCAIIISGGFSETDDDGAALEAEVKAVAERSGIRVVGPNCMGVYNPSSGLDTVFVPRERFLRPPAGSLAILSQSGTSAVTIMDELASVGVGVGKVVSYGNMADVNEADCLEFLANDMETSAVAIYMESVSNGRAFVEAASRCSAVKPVVVLKVGRSASGAAAVRSHTGAMAGRYEIYKAAFRKAGLVEVSNYEEFIGACKALGTEKRSTGGRVVVLTDGGGMGVEIADLCSEPGLGLTLPELDPDLALDLVSVFPEYYQVGNPMDLTWSVSDEVLAGALEKTLEKDYYDMAIVAAHWGPPAITSRLADMVAAVAESSGKPIIVCSPGGECSRGRAGRFIDLGLPVFHTPASAVRAASVLARTARPLEGAGN